MSDKDKAMQQALEALECMIDDLMYKDHKRVIDISNVAITALRTALEQQQAEPVQKLVAWGVFDGNLHDMFFTEEEAQEMVRLKGDGSIVAPLYTTPPQQQAEPVAMRMPKVGDKVICLEDESLGEVVSLTAGGSPDILFDDGSHGTYLLREFAELFGYAEQRQPLTKDKARTLEA